MEQHVMVYCVVCITPGNRGEEVTHIFSSHEKAQAFADGDTERAHVFYEYLLDCPERHEGDAQ